MNGPQNGNSDLNTTSSIFARAAARDFAARRGARREHIRRDLRPARQSLAAKGPPPGGLLVKGSLASLLTPHRSMRICSSLASRQRAFYKQRHVQKFMSLCLISIGSHGCGASGWQPVKKLWIPPFHQKPGAGEARQEKIRMDLRLRSNEASARFLMKPSGLRSFWLWPLSLLAHRSIRICSLVAPRPKPKILSAAVSIVF